jgi:hypothetical protein
MSIYDIDYTIVGPQLLPPDKRRTRQMAWVKALLKPLQYLHDIMFISYKVGSTDPQYAGGTYNKGDRVVYFFSVYESKVATNASLPTDATKWVKIQENFIGVDERVKYNGQKIVLEYALNKWFVTQFRQPPLQSDIYITVNQIIIKSFLVGGTTHNSSVVGFYKSSETIGAFVGSSGVVNMDVHIPVSVFNALASTDAQRAAIVRSFVNKYITAGITYNILTY